MDRRWNYLYIIPLLLAFIVFSLTEQIIFMAAAFGVGLLIMQVLRTRLLPPHLHKAVRAFQQGDTEEAAELVDMAISARPDRWESHYLRSLIHFTQTKLPEAERDAQKAIELNPKVHTTYIALGQVYYAQTNFEQAKEAFTEAVTRMGKQASNQYHVGTAHYRLEEYDQAIPRLELATKLGLDNPQLYLLAFYYLARSLEAQGHEEDAQNAYQEMGNYANALDGLKQDTQHVAHFPALDLLRQDVKAIELRLSANKQQT